MPLLHPALKGLARLKFRAWFRKLRLRMSTPAGIVFGLLGVSMMGLWIFSIAFRGQMFEDTSVPVHLHEPFARGGFFLLTLISIFGSLSHRGLYLPKDEIERLLSAPISRYDLVRYRMVANSVRSLVFAVISSVLVAQRTAVGAFGFIATFFGVMTVPLLGVAISLFAGDAENRFGRIVKRLPTVTIRVVTALVFWVLIMGLLFGDELIDLLPGTLYTEFGLADLLQSPIFGVLTAPLTPWSRAATATSLGQFLPWFALLVFIWFVMFDVVARIPVDFRELSMETSQDVARRLRRFSSGRNLISGGKVSKRTLGWRIPFLFGHGPFGAIAWLKLCAIVRKSRGALIFAAVVIGFATVFTTVANVDGFSDPLGGAVFLAVLGVFYLCSGLRFDFRSDLDLMETIKTWPLAPWRTFLATILPEVLVISTLVTVALCVRAAVLGSFPVELIAVVCGVPIATLLWTALDNAVFLFAPVRFVPGQDGAMHHTGRAMALVFLRMALLGLSALLVGAAGFGAYMLAGALELDRNYRIGLTASAGLLVIAAVFAALVACGAWALRRYDVARQKILTS